jgi:hypothetical protein
VDADNNGTIDFPGMRCIWCDLGREENNH